MAPGAAPRRWIDTIGHPMRALSLSVFSALHHITADTDENYPCAAANGDGASATEAQLASAFGRAPALEDNDGVVPLRSQLWGTLAWAGLGDHLDVLGHYRDDRDDVPDELRHSDWLTSGSAFTHTHFAALIDAIATGMLAG